MNIIIISAIVGGIIGAVIMANSFKKKQNK